MNFIKIGIFFIILLIIIVFTMIFYGYQKSHIKIDENYKIIDDKTGFSLIDFEDKVLTSSNRSIVWYCSSPKYVLGCLGESLLYKTTEPYSLKCLEEYFILNKRNSRYVEKILKKDFLIFIKENNIECKKNNLVE